VGGRTREITRSSVLLPAPFRPMTATRSPGATETFTFESAVKSS
jgi:hypothetical protein